MRTLQGELPPLVVIWAMQRMRLQVAGVESMSSPVVVAVGLSMLGEVK